MTIRQRLGLTLFALRPGLTSFSVFLLATGIPWRLGSLLVIAAGVTLVLWTFKTRGGGGSTIDLSLAGGGVALSVVSLLAVSAIGGAVGGVMLGSGRPWAVGTFTLMLVPALAATTIMAVAIGRWSRSSSDVSLEV